MQMSPYPYPYPPQGPDPALLAERKNLRRSAGAFGLAAILYFALSMASSFFLGFCLRQLRLALHGPVFGNSEVSYYIFNMASYLVSFAGAFLPYVLIIKMPWRTAFRFGPVRAGTVLLSIPATFAISVVGSILTSILSILFSVTGFQPVSNDVATPMTVPGTILYFIMLAVLPALVEEMVFRGILMQSLRRFGDFFALLVSAILFGLFHLNMVQAPYAFLLGLWFGYLVLRTGSLWISVVLHFCINLSAGFMSIIISGADQETVVMLNLVYIVFWIATGVTALLILFLRHFGPSLKLYPANTLMKTSQKMAAFFTSVPVLFSLGIILIFMIQNFVRVG